MRRLLCVSRTLTADLREPRPLRRLVDASVHVRRADAPRDLPDDVSLGDLPEMRAVLAAASRAGHIVVGRGARSGSPSSAGTRIRRTRRACRRRCSSAGCRRRSTDVAQRRQPCHLVLAARRVADSSPYQSGLFYAAGARSRTCRASGFRSSRSRVATALRVGPDADGEARSHSRPAEISLAMEDARGAHYDRAGIFRRTFATVQRGYVRARLAGTSDFSLPFSLKAVPDHIYTPFGGIPLEAPKKKKGG